IKWVLGESSAKTLRAEDMEDVIFKGTETRKSMSIAEVTLTVANEENLLPIETSEIAIKRRIYRSGENEYFINGAQVRLKDIRELFWDTGVGKAAYSVMEQGKVSQILSSKAEDRRYLFEEAAGITRSKTKYAQAERDLANTEQKMVEIEREIEREKQLYDSLKIQTEKAIKHREIREKIFYLELDIQLLKLRNFSNDREQKKQNLDNLLKSRDIILKEIEEIEESLSLNTEEINNIQKKRNDLELSALDLQRNVNSHKEIVQIHQNQKNESAGKIEQIEGKKRVVQLKIDTLEEETEEQRNIVATNTKRLRELEENILAFEKNISVTTEQIEANNLKLGSIRARNTELENNRGELQKFLEEITENIVAELDVQLKNAGYSSSTNAAARETVLQNLNQLKIRLDSRQRELEDWKKNPLTPEEMSQRIAIGLEELSQTSANLEKSFEEYEKTLPSFIDEFLQPQGIITKKREIDKQIQLSRAEQDENLKTTNQIMEENVAMEEKISEYTETLNASKMSEVGIQAKLTGANEKIRLLERDISGQQDSLREIDDELWAEKRRSEEMEEKIATLQDEIAEMEYRGQKMVAEIRDLEQSVLKKTNDSSSGREKLRKKNEERSSCQEQIENLNLKLATSEVEIRNIKENFSEKHSRDLMEFEERMFTITEKPEVLREKLAAENATLKELGPPNYSAPDEFAEVKKRYELLTKQFDDITRARNDLRGVATDIRETSTKQFLETYNKIKRNFHNMFRRLFDGGAADLKLTDPKNVLESGIEIYARPPQKKLENITLLSGGEQTMTALALLFATYMVHPSPFCLLDEIDAALDGANIDRFVQTLTQYFAKASQYIIITHNHKTSSAAGTLLGVTMQDKGVTKIVSIKTSVKDEAGNASMPEIEPFVEEDVPEEEGIELPPHRPKRYELNRNNGGEEASGMDSPEQGGEAHE
ncbi:MAG: AAA family ATPase, partial [Spirochaetaceae bacterium]|nr:AAA family ATPase [Spirochaetaceae bacterium]